MSKIFSSLEIRYFEDGVYLARELEDAQEVLFVDEGYYKVGFTINNVENLNLIFGKSTNIGAYNVMFRMRHQFMYQSMTKMLCFAIRLFEFNDIFNEIP